MSFAHTLLDAAAKKKKTSQLKPCPFCAGTRLSVLEKEPDEVCVTCDDCGTDGPVFETADSDKTLDTEDAARLAWNRRLVRVDAHNLHDSEHNPSTGCPNGVPYCEEYPDCVHNERKECED